MKNNQFPFVLKLHDFVFPVNPHGAVLFQPTRSQYHIISPQVDEPKSLFIASTRSNNPTEQSENGSLYRAFPTSCVHFLQSSVSPLLRESTNALLLESRSNQGKSQK